MKSKNTSTDRNNTYGRKKSACLKLFSRGALIVCIALVLAMVILAMQLGAGSFGQYLKRIAKDTDREFILSFSDLVENGLATIDNTAYAESYDSLGDKKLADEYESPSNGTSSKTFSISFTGNLKTAANLGRIRVAASFIVKNNKAGKTQKVEIKNSSGSVLKSKSTSEDGVGASVQKTGAVNAGSSFSVVYTCTGGKVAFVSVIGSIKDLYLYITYTGTASGTFESADTNKGTVDKSSYSINTFDGSASSTATAKTGYHFTSWSGSPTASTAKITVYGYNATGTYTANFAANTYKITYYKNDVDGGGTTSTQSGLKYGSSYSFKASTTFTWTNHTFKCWNTKADGTGTTYYAGNSFSNLTSTNNGEVKLYAIWQFNFTLQYDPYQGTNGTNFVVTAISGTTPSNQTVTNGNSFTISSTTLTRPGYTHVGWSTSNALGDVVIGSSASFTGNGTTKFVQGATYSSSIDGAKAGGTVTLYAVWRRNKYTISVDKNGATSGSISGTGTVDFGIAKNVWNFGNLAKTGYDYDGLILTNTSADSATSTARWGLYSAGENYTGMTAITNGTKFMPTGGDLYFHSLSTANNDTVTITVQWVAKTYTVNYYSAYPEGGDVNKTGLTFTYDNEKVSEWTPYSLRMTDSSLFYNYSGNSNYAYKFYGWTKTKGSLTRDFAYNATSYPYATDEYEEKIDLYAIWMYDVRVYTTATAYTTQRIYLSYPSGGRKCTTLNTATKSGYDFMGYGSSYYAWYDADNVALTASEVSSSGNSSTMNLSNLVGKGFGVGMSGSVQYLNLYGQYFSTGAHGGVGAHLEFDDNVSSSGTSVSLPAPSEPGKFYWSADVSGGAPQYNTAEGNSIGKIDWDPGSDNALVYWVQIMWGPDMLQALANDIDFSFYFKTSSKFDDGTNDENAFAVNFIGSSTYSTVPTNAIVGSGRSGSDASWASSFSAHKSGWENGNHNNATLGDTKYNSTYKVPKDSKGIRIIFAAICDGALDGGFHSYDLKLYYNADQSYAAKVVTVKGTTATVTTTTATSGLNASIGGIASVSNATPSWYKGVPTFTTSVNESSAASGVYEFQGWVCGKTSGWNGKTSFTFSTPTYITPSSVVYTYKSNYQTYNDDSATNYYYAVYVFKGYTITYSNAKPTGELNDSSRAPVSSVGGSVNNTAHAVSTASALRGPTEIYSMTGYTFKGWTNLQPATTFFAGEIPTSGSTFTGDASRRAFAGRTAYFWAPGASVKGSDYGWGANSTQTLYAVWVPKITTITTKTGVNWGTNDTCYVRYDDQAVYSESTATTIKNADIYALGTLTPKGSTYPTATGYYFGGWATNNSGPSPTTIADSDGQLNTWWTTSGNNTSYTLYAKWAFHIRYYRNQYIGDTSTTTGTFYKGFTQSIGSYFTSNYTWYTEVGIQVVEPSACI